MEYTIKTNKNGKQIVLDKNNKPYTNALVVGNGKEIKTNANGEIVEEKEINSKVVHRNFNTSQDCSEQ